MFHSLENQSCQLGQFKLGAGLGLSLVQKTKAGYVRAYAYLHPAPSVSSIKLTLGFHEDYQKQAPRVFSTFGVQFPVSMKTT